MKHYVEIFKHVDDDGKPLEKSEVVKRMGPMGVRQADKVRAGAEINLNYDQYAVRVVHEENGE